jgi:hypothetical protein
MWLGLLCVAVAMAIAAQVFIIQLFGAALSLYAAQGLISEFLGVRVSANSVVTPRRFAAAPLFTLWRKRAPLGSILNLTAMSQSQGRERVICNISADANALMLFPNRKMKLAFFQAVTKYRPGIRIYRQ